MGDSIALLKTITREQIIEFARVSGDTNPVHLDEEYAKTTRFKRCIAHGVMIDALISKVLGTIFPGPGTILLSLSTKYLKPVYPGTVIKIKVTIKAIDKDKSILTFTTEAIDQCNKSVAEGEAVILFDKN